MADHRVNVNFSDEAYATLTEISEKRDKTKAEVLRDAIALDKWIRGIYAEGGRVLVDRNGTLQEIVLL